MTLTYRVFVSGWPQRQLITTGSTTGGNAETVLVYNFNQSIESHILKTFQTTHISTLYSK